MKNTYKLKTIELQEGTTEILEMTDASGVVSCVPMVAGNADYEAYLNPQAEQSTPMVTNEANPL